MPSEEDPEEVFHQSAQGLEDALRYTREQTPDDEEIEELDERWTELRNRLSRDTGAAEDQRDEVAHEAAYLMTVASDAIRGIADRGGRSYDQAENILDELEDLGGPRGPTSTRRRAIRWGLGALTAGALGGAAVVAGSEAYDHLTDPEFTPETYDPMIEDHGDLNELGNEYSVSSHKSLRELAGEIDSALDDHRRVSIGLDSQLLGGYADIGIRRNNHAEWTLQSRTELGDGYSRALELARDI